LIDGAKHQKESAFKKIEGGRKKRNERKTAYTGDMERNEERSREIYGDKNIKIGDRNYKLRNDIGGEINGLCASITNINEYGILNA
jgi:hypothetical protein